MTEDGITFREFSAADGTEDWPIVVDGASAFFRTGSLAEAARFVGAIGDIAGIEEHRPAIDIRADGVTVRFLTTGDDWWGISRRDLDLARKVSAVARSQGLESDPSVVQSLLVIPGALNTAEVVPFWQAVLGYDRRPDSPDRDLVDRHDRGAPFWFERMRESRGDGGGAIHIAVWVPYQQAEARVAAALAAGGRLVRDSDAPASWTLADAAGNEADIATTRGRD